MNKGQASQSFLLGSRLAKELARRGELGMYFSYEEYQSLNRLRDANELRSFLKSAGYPTVVSSNDVIQVANGLREAKEFEDLPSVMLADPTGILGSLGTTLWLLIRKLRSKPQFPTKDQPARDYNGRLLE